MRKPRLRWTFAAISIALSIASHAAGTEDATRESGAEPPLPSGVSEAPFPASEDEIAGHVEFLASPLLRGREAGTPGEAIAAAYVASEFRKLGLIPGGEDGGWESSFDLAVGSRGDKAETKEHAVRKSRNVLAWLRAPDPSRPWILVGAHLDHLGVDDTGAIYRGADDNASGVAGLISIAEALAAWIEPLSHDVLFAAFGAEEKGLVGSRHLARRPPRPLGRLSAMINLDMIGRPRFLDRAAFQLPKRFTGIVNGPGVGAVTGDAGRPLLTYARRFAELDRLPLYAPEDFPLLEKSIRGMTDGRADSFPFRERRVPTLFLSTSENDDYHQTTDTPEKVDPAVVRRIAAVAFRVVLAVDGAGKTERATEDAPDGDGAKARSESEAEPRNAPAKR